MQQQNKPRRAGPLGFAFALLDRYNSLLERYPFEANAYSTALIGALSDVLRQFFEHLLKNHRSHSGAAVVCNSTSSAEPSSGRPPARLPVSISAYLSGFRSSFSARSVLEQYLLGFAVLHPLCFWFFEKIEAMFHEADGDAAEVAEAGEGTRRAAAGAAFSAEKQKPDPAGGPRRRTLYLDALEAQGAADETIEFFNASSQPVAVLSPQSSRRGVAAFAGFGTTTSPSRSVQNQKVAEVDRFLPGSPGSPTPSGSARTLKPPPLVASAARTRKEAVGPLDRTTTTATSTTTEEQPHSPLKKFWKAFQKVSVEELVFAPVFNLVFLTCEGVLAGESVGDSVRKYLAKFRQLQLSNMVFWYPTNLVNFYVVPPDKRMLFANLMNILWMVYLSMKSKE